MTRFLEKNTRGLRDAQLDTVAGGQPSDYPDCETSLWAKLDEPLQILGGNKTLEWLNSGCIYTSWK